jgi:hypothetical protein
MLARLAFALAAAVLFAGPATAQTMDFACPLPGTVFVFDSGTQVVAKGTDKDDCLMDVAGGAPFRMRSLLFTNPAPDGSDSTAFIAALKPERLWPLEVGKRIEATYSGTTGSGAKGTWTYVLTVARRQTLTGPDGKPFDTFVVEMNEAGQNSYRSVSRWWISPEVKYLIRFDSSDSNNVSSRALVTAITK